MAADDDPLRDEGSMPDDGSTARDSGAGAPPIRTHVRRRRMAPLAVPLGVAALGLGGIASIQDVPNRHAVEHRLADRSVAALSSAGISGYVVFDGRDATVHVASAADRDRALALVRGQQGVRIAHVVVDSPASKGEPAATQSSTGSSKVPRPPDVRQPPATRQTPPPSDSPRAKQPASARPAPSSGSRATVQAELAALGPIRFGTGSMSLTPAARSEVARIAGILRASPGLRVTIDGFADSSGLPASNLALSRQRAETVYHTLRILGIPADRMTMEGHGEADPAAPNDSAVHRAANRRVTVTVR